jgi:hypothetical protein
MAVALVIALGTLLVAGVLHLIDLIKSRRPVVVGRVHRTEDDMAWSTFVPTGVRAGVRASIRAGVR